MSKRDLTEEEACWNLWILNRDSEAGDKLVRKYTPLVTYHVQRISAGASPECFQGRYYEPGTPRTVRCVDKIRPKQRFEIRYICFCVWNWGTIIDGLRKEDWLPRSSREKTKKLEEEITKLEQRLLRHATPEEIATHIGISVDEVYETVHEHYFSNVLSIDEKLNDSEEDGQKSFVIKDQDTKSPEQKTMMNELVGDLAAKIKELNNNEQLVLNLFYTEEMTLTEIGEILSLSTSRISQIHSKALFKLRKLLSSEIVDGGIL